MQDNLMWTVKLLHVAIEQNIQQQTFDNNISSTQAMILHILYSLDSSEGYAVNLCNVMGISRVTISTAIKDLRNKGYLKVSTDAADDRKKKITLTEKAFDIRESIENNLQKQQEKLCWDIPNEHLLWLEDDLKTMIENMKNSKSRTGGTVIC